MTANEIVLDVIAGSSPQMRRVFTAGVPVSPFSVGSCGDWKINAPDVDGAHLYLAFDGQRLHVAAVSPGSNLFVLGAAVGTSFIPLAAPCNVFFGGACISVTASAEATKTVPLAFGGRSAPLPDLSRIGHLPTQLLDVAQAMHMRTQRLDLSPAMLASLRDAPKAPEAAGATGSHEVLPARVTTLSGRHDLASTLYDGGALRERAQQLASGSLAPSVLPAPELTPEAPPAERRGLFHEPMLAFRRASPVRQLVLLLAPVAIAVGVWGLREPGSSAAAPRTAVVSVAAHSVPVPAATPPAPRTPVLASTAPRAPEPTAAPAPSEGLERAALAAAFSGNKLEAAALYDRLATGNNARVFALAAQLARADRVRKP